MAARSERSDRFQILALGGGGLKGLFSAAVLAGLEDDLGCRVSDHFDLIIGTSTGGVIALALGLGLRPRELMEFYVREGPDVFQNPLKLRSVARLWGSKYRAKNLEGALRAVFGESHLGDSQKPLVIPAYNLGEDDVYLFKTPHHEKLTRDWRVPMWQVAMATAAAPTYLPAFALSNDRVRLVDGGVWANNPTMLGVTEAVSMFDKDLTDIHILSLGTTSDLRRRKRGLDRGGLVQWGIGNHAIDVILQGQNIGAYTQACHLLGPSHVERLDPLVPAGFFRLDSANADDLIGKAAHESRKLAPVFKTKFTNHRPPLYVPSHACPKPKGDSNVGVG